ncbi:MAG: cation:dicarboxylate symporter family transporter [Planctomycetota bacterium]
MAIFVTFYIASKSVFGPRGSILALAAALGSSGMDPSQVAAGFVLLVGIDPLLDMPRTGVNMLGTMTTACLVSRWQGIKHINTSVKTEPCFEQDQRTSTDTKINMQTA